MLEKQTTSLNLWLQMKEMEQEDDIILYAHDHGGFVVMPPPLRAYANCWVKEYIYPWIILC